MFVNVGRGKLVDDEALYKYLQNGKMQGAGLDVTYKEPYDSDYILLKNEI